MNPIPKGPLKLTADSNFTSKSQQLAGAHKGYIYQDVAVAYFLVRALVEGATAVDIDQKQFKEDLFDDLVIHYGDKTVKRQFKTSIDGTKELSPTHLKTKTSNLRLDDVLHCIRRLEEMPADEYRICATWKEPSDNRLADLLQVAQVQGSFPGENTKLYQLDIDGIWPKEGDFIWRSDLNLKLSREEFVQAGSKLFIELECPDVSLDQQKPGALERLLMALLVDRVGVGRTPNQNRVTSDIADVLVRRASLARTKSETIDPQTLPQQLGLRTNFGRVPQEIPIIHEQRVSLKVTKTKLKETILENGCVIVRGAPGSGKSWLLTAVANELEEDGHVVARHYCYVSPADPLKAERIRTDTLYGNLIAELLDSEPSLQADQLSKYGATLSDLSHLLAKASKHFPQRRIVLVVDGLDHIARVLAEETEVSPAEADIVESIASITLPANVVLVIGTQPGGHYDSLLNRGVLFQCGAWIPAHIIQLAARTGILKNIVTRSLGRGELQAFVSRLVERAEGNPLYARFLCIQTQQQLSSAPGIVPSEFLQSAPALNGDMNRYYEFLLGSHGPNKVARVLACAEFGISSSALIEILPEDSPEVAGWLAVLWPVLSSASLQGGFTIYHESFRRYILEHASTQMIAKSALYGPLITWLKSKDFYRDGRSFRFLLSLLSRIAAHSEVLDILGHDFPAISLAFGHTEAAIQTNLQVGFRAAQHTLDWPAFARLTELSRSVISCFHEKLYDFEAFGRAFSEIHGLDLLVERLVFDAKPTFPRGPGLILCSLCQDAGLTPPWNEYLNSEETEVYSSSDGLKESIAEIHGIIVTDGGTVAARFLLKQLSAGIRREYFVQALERLLRSAGVDPVRKLAKVLAKHKRNKAASLIELSLARWLETAGFHEQAKQSAELAFALNTSLETALQCLRLGLGSSLKKPLRKQLKKFTHILANTGKHQPDSSEVQTWLNMVDVAAGSWPKTLARTIPVIKHEGWFGAWMRFAIKLSLAEKLLNRPEQEEAITSSLEELATVTDPFAGVPRSPDLYGIGHEIRDTLRRALQLLGTPSAWERATIALESMNRNLTTTLQNSPWGPCDEKVLLSLYGEQTHLPHLADTIWQSAERIVARSRSGYYYENQANLSLGLVHINHKGGREEDARKNWTLACDYFFGYGFRKDTTIYEVLESVPSLGRSGFAQTVGLLAKLQPLLKEIDAHTDGKDTRHAIINWFRLLLDADRQGATVCLAESLIVNPVTWRLKECLWIHIASESSSFDVDLLSLVLDLYCDPDGKDLSEENFIDAQLKLVDALSSQGDDAAGRFGLLIEALRATNKLNVHYEALRKCSENNGLLFEKEQPPDDEIGIGQHKNRLENPVSIDVRLEYLFSEPVFEATSRVSQMCLRLRDLGNRRYDESPSFRRVCEATAYRVIELAQNGDLLSAKELLITFTHEYHYYTEGKSELLTNLAETLKTTQPSLATTCLTLAYVVADVGKSFRILGSESHFDLLRQALAIDSEQTFHSLAESIAKVLHQVGTYTMGLTRHLIELCAALVSPAVGMRTWEEAYSVIKRRLPVANDSLSEFADYRLDAQQVISVDEMSCLLLLSRLHDDLAFLCLHDLLATDPALVIRSVNILSSFEVPPLKLAMALRLLLVDAFNVLPHRTAIETLASSLINHENLLVKDQAQKLLFAIES